MEKLPVQTFTCLPEGSYGTRVNKTTTNSIQGLLPPFLECIKGVIGNKGGDPP